MRNEGKLTENQQAGGMSQMFQQPQGIPQQPQSIPQQPQNLPQQGINYGVKSNTNHLGFPQEDDLFGIKDLKNIQISKLSKNKKNNKRRRSTINQNDLSNLDKFLKMNRQSPAQLI